MTAKARYSTWLEETAVTDYEEEWDAWYIVNDEDQPDGICLAPIVHGPDDRGEQIVIPDEALNAMGYFRDGRT